MSLTTNISLRNCEQLFVEIIDSIKAYEYRPESWEVDEADWYVDDFIRGYIAYKIFVEQNRQYGTPCSKQFICNYLKIDAYDLETLIEKYEFDIDFEVTKRFLVVNKMAINLEWCRKNMNRLLKHFPANHFDAGIVTVL